jgi:hypothetical protein
LSGKSICSDTPELMSFAAAGIKIACPSSNHQHIKIMKKVTTGIAALMLLAGGTLYAQGTSERTVPKQNTDTTTQQGNTNSATKNYSTTNNAINPTGQRNDGWNTNQATQSDTSMRDNSTSAPVNNSTTNNAINPTGQQNGSPFSTDPATQGNTSQDNKARKNRKDKKNSSDPH